MSKTATITAEIDPILKAEVENIFKEETLKAIDEAEKGIDLVVCDNAEDMFKKLGR